MWLRTTVFACFTLIACRALGQDFGFTWCTVGDAGNRAATHDEFPGTTYSLGAVPYDFRMTQSKLSTSQYADFLNAYAPFWTGDPNDPSFVGRFVVRVPQSGGGFVYQPRPGMGNYAADMSWPMAARYCNWLQNDKAHAASAFESGVYDTSTFHFTGPNWSAQMTPSPGARYWIPSLDELTKAIYYDPNRYGTGQGGYWVQPNGSNTPLVMGLPGQGQTIGDLLWQNDPTRQPGEWALGQYPGVQSPWGLMDVSATIPDYTSFVVNHNTATLAMGGSMAGDPAYAVFDRGDLFFTGVVWGGTLGSLRIASTVPAPSSLLLMSLGAMLIRRRRE